jgi:hypothetical protein
MEEWKYRVMHKIYTFVREPRLGDKWKNGNIGSYTKPIDFVHEPIFPFFHMSPSLDAQAHVRITHYIIRIFHI